MIGLRGPACVLLAALLLGGSIAEAASPGSRSWTVVDVGRSGSHSWVVNVRRDEGSGRLCVRVGITVKHGPISFGRSRFRQCSDDSTRLTAKSPPLLAGGALFGRVGSPAMTVLGLVLAPAAHQVRATFSDGTVKTAPARRPTTSQLRKLGAGEIRYAVIAIRGTRCAERVVSRDSHGKGLGWARGAAGACGA